MVTNTGNATLTAVAVTDTIDGVTVPVTCAQTVLLPAAQTTCNASYVSTGTDVTAGSIASSATVSGTDYVPATVTSTASVVLVPYVPPGTSPLPASKLKISAAPCVAAQANWPQTCDPAAVVPYWLGQYHAGNPYAQWTVSGSTSTDSTGSTTCSTTCSTTSSPPTTGPDPWTLCLGGAGLSTTFTGTTGTTLGSISNLSVASTAEFPPTGEIVVQASNPYSGGGCLRAPTPYAYAVLSYSSLTPTAFQGVAVLTGQPGDSLQESCSASPSS